MGIIIATAQDGTERTVDSWIWYNAAKAWRQTISSVLREAFPEGADSGAVMTFLEDLAAEKGDGDGPYSDDYAHGPAMFRYLTEVEGSSVEDLLTWGSTA